MKKIPTGMENYKPTKEEQEQIERVIQFGSDLVDAIRTVPKGALRNECVYRSISAISIGLTGSRFLAISLLEHIKTDMVLRGFKDKKGKVELV